MDVVQLDLGGGGASSATAVHVHPVVLFTVLDSHIRRGKDQDRVIGCLLGTYANGVYEVTNAFGVYFTIDFNQQKGEDELLVRRQTLLDMIELHRKVNPKEILLGWYSTWTGGPPGPDGKEQHVDHFALVVHREIIVDAAAKKNGVANPIYMLVDTSLQTPHFGLYSYLPIANAMTANLLVQFRQLRTTLVATTEERVAMDAMTRNTIGSGVGPVVPSAIGEARAMSGDVDVLDGSLKRLRRLLDSVCTYVDEVVEGKRIGDEAIGRAIADAIAAVPRNVSESIGVGSSNTGSEGASAAGRATQDVLMVSYLTTMAQRQLELAERISQVAQAVQH